MLQVVKKPENEASAELLATAEALGIPVEALLSTFSYPKFKDGTGYKLKVVDAKNTTSKKGALQVQLTMSAVAAAGKVVKGARFAEWIPYPFDNRETGYKVEEQAREEARRKMGFLLRLKRPELKTYDLQVVGGKKVYFQDDKEVPQSGLNGLFTKDKIVVFGACREAQKDASVFKDITYYAIFTPWQNKKGEPQPGWSRQSAEPLADFSYALDRGQMFTQSEGSQAPATDDIDALV